MVSNPEANPGPLYRHGPAPGTFPQPNRNHTGLNINRDKKSNERKVTFALASRIY
jgi:hypothetical protein